MTSKRRIPDQEILRVSASLAIFLRAGVPIVDAFHSLQIDAATKSLRQLLASMESALRSGESLGVAVTARPDAFRPLYASLIRAAELTGTLDTALDQVVDHLRRDLAVRSSLKAALRYPTFVVVTAVSAVIVLTVVVLPRFEVLFESLGTDLPWATRALLSFTDAVRTGWPWAALAGLVGAAAAAAARATATGRAAFDRVRLQLPVIGPATRLAALERTCGVLAIVLRTGVPLADGMVVTADAAGNGVFRSGLLQARSAMLQGEGVAGPLADTGLFPTSVRQLLRVGEETGTMERQLDAAAGYVRGQLDESLARATALVEPIVIVLVGLVVGFISLALVSAMYGAFSGTPL